MNTILQVISDTNIGGGGRSLLNYLSCQDRSQFQSQVVLPRGSALKGPVEALGVPVHEIDAMRTGPWICRRWLPCAGSSARWTRIWSTPTVPCPHGWLPGCAAKR